jgi:hypothetical protein
MKCAWCVSEKKCVQDIQGLCTSMEDHIGTLGNQDTCPSKVDILASSVKGMLFGSQEL